MIRSDVVIMIVVSVLVVISNIVVAVGVGLALACAAYAWQSSQALTVVAYTMTAPAAPGGGGQPETIKVYEVDGPLFFAVTKAFGDYFTPEDDPERVICTFTRGGELHDYTMMDAMVGLTAAYKAEGKKIEFHSLKSSSILAPCPHQAAHHRAQCTLMDECSWPWHLWPHCHKCAHRDVCHLPRQRLRWCTSTMLPHGNHHMQGAREPFSVQLALDQ